ncbi:MAG: HD domain-containing protein, partial [Deltaproteobacteria bacterium]|nr:HD domain-containing protein [Deltaproteobacteria bacterium]
LLDAFVRTIGDAIDEKSPYTAGHVFRVANLTEKIALEVNSATTGKFAPISFSADELAEIRMAAWLHDVGKITTPEHLMDKATKLETIFDRIELIRHRVEISRLNDAITRMESEPHPRKEGRPAPQRPVEKTEEWQEIINFLDTINLGGEGLPAGSIEKVRRLAGITYAMNGMDMPLLGSDEVENLCVQRGTLTAAERKVMNHHVDMSIRMLEGLPFPKKLRNVAAYAGMHHEKLNGTGYPRGLANGAIPLPARMLALADVLEALTAADRPYKPGKMLSEAMGILEGLVERGDLDGELCDLVVESGLIARFAQDLSRRQRDDFFWRGKLYCI